MCVVANSDLPVACTYRYYLLQQYLEKDGKKHVETVVAGTSRRRRGLARVSKRRRWPECEAPHSLFGFGFMLYILLFYFIFLSIKEFLILLADLSSARASKKNNQTHLQ